MVDVELLGVTLICICTHCAICMCCLCIVLLVWRSSAQDYKHSLTSSREDGEYSECIYIHRLSGAICSLAEMGL